MQALNQPYPTEARPEPRSHLDAVVIPNDVLRRTAAIAPNGPYHSGAHSFLSPPRTAGIWAAVTCTWALLAGARVLFYALEHARYPEIVPPVTADVIEGVLLWPCAIFGCWGATAIWTLKGRAMAIATAIASAIVFGALSRLAYGVGTLLSAPDPSSRHWLAQFDSTGRGFLLPWVSNTVEYAALYLSCLGLTLGYLSYRGLQEERLRHQRAEILATTERLRALRAQVNPHFLFNSLNSIVGMGITSPATARTLATQLGDLMRRTLRASECEWHSLEEELAYVSEYLHLQDVRQPNHVVWHVTSDAPPSLEVPTLVLLPLIENAVVHGNARVDAPIRLEVRVSATATHVVMEVTNTVGQPRSEETLRGIGMGLSNLRERLSILFGQAASLNTEQSDATRWRTSIECVINAQTEARSTRSTA
jgi:Histidine kinase